jgi:hypothetical protein
MCTLASTHVLARLADICQTVLRGLARLADIRQTVLWGLARLAYICQTILWGLARLADICQKPFFRKTSPKRWKITFFQSLVNLANVWQAQNFDKRENVGTCRTRQHLPSTFVRTHQIHCHLPNHIARAHQTCPHSPSHFVRTRQTRLHSQNAIFEKMCLSLLNSSEYWGSLANGVRVAIAYFCGPLAK